MKYAWPTTKAQPGKVVVENSLADIHRRIAETNTSGMMEYKKPQLKVVGGTQYDG